MSIIVVRNNKIVDVDAEFTELTGYEKWEAESLGIESFFSHQLRSNYGFCNNNSSEADDFIIFTKHLEVREVEIHQVSGSAVSDTIVLINEKPHSRIESKLMCTNKTLEENLFGVGIFKVPGYILLKANQQYLDFLGSPFDRAEYSYGKDLSQILPDWQNSQVKQVFDEIVQTDRSLHITEHAGLLLDDFSRYWDNSLTPVSENGRVRYLVSQLSEVTDRVMNDEFLYIMSHEFKTPLAVISSAIQTMELVYKDHITSKLEKYLNVIKQNTNRQLRLVNNLLDITRIGSGFARVKRKTINIVSLTNAILDSVELYAMQKHIQLVFTCSFKELYIPLDEEKYERIMLNLLSNAIKFTANGKSISVNITRVEHSDRDMVCIAVKDEGIGIPPDKQEHIFERFGQADTTLTRQAEGTGIGLYLVKLLVTALDGIIELDSTTGEGSTFNVLLPVIKNDADDGEICEQLMLSDQGNSRFIQAAAIEFSDIYF